MAISFTLNAEDFAAELAQRAYNNLAAEIRKELQRTADDAVQQATDEIMRQLQVYAETHRDPYRAAMVINVSVVDRRPKA